MTKKELEKSILFCIYKEDVISQNLLETETPDFIITDPQNSLKIGVEITTVYSNEAGGMLKNEKFLDSYIDSHLKTHENKNNKKKPRYLKSVHVEKVIGGEQAVHKGHVVWQIITLDEYFNFFQKIILTKSNSYTDVNGEIEFVTLIANDEENFFKPHKGDIGDIYSLIRQHDIYSSLVSSNFQEIFLITDFPSGKYGIPLIKYIFESEYFIFLKFWEKLNTINPELIPNKVKMMNNFCLCLLHMGFKNLYIFQDKEFRYFVYGISYIKVNLLNFEIAQLDFLAMKLPQNANAFQVITNFQNYKEIYLQYLEFRSNTYPKFDNHYFSKIS